MVSKADFLATMPPPFTYSDRICASESIRQDLKRAVPAGLLPAEARFWVRELSTSPLISVEVVAWPGAVLAESYAAVMMECYLARRGVQSSHVKSVKDYGAVGDGLADDTMSVQVAISAAAGRGLVVFPNSKGRYNLRAFNPPQDARLSLEVNEALELIKILGDRRIEQLMATRPRNYYGSIQYSVVITNGRLITAAERGLRLEVDPAYADFMRRAQQAATRLGKQAVRGICGEGGVDLSSEKQLEELMKLDEEAAGRPVHYDRSRHCWVVVVA